jgi:hypothetical protein
MPRKNIIQISVEVEEDQAAYLKTMTEEYGLADESKALRVLLDFAIVDGDKELIYDMRNMRCRHCVV